MNHISVLIFLVALLTPKHESPFACNLNALTAAERARHFAQLGPMLRLSRTAVRELPNGYEFEFPGDRKTTALLVEWIAQERLCCPFFDIELHLGRDNGPARLRLTGREGTKQFIQASAGPWIKQ
jgi:hypothetical protein